MRTFLLVLILALSACGKDPCPGAPAAANDCTDTFRYGPACETQPSYTLSGDTENEARFSSFCSHILDAAVSAR